MSEKISHFKFLRRGSLTGFRCNLIFASFSSIVFEVLGEKKNFSEASSTMPYLIANSPISDVSDYLIDIDDVDGGIERITRTLEKLQSFLIGIKKAKVAARTKIYFSEGYDNSYRDITSSLGTLRKDCLEIFESSDEMISLSINLSLR